MIIVRISVHCCPARVDPDGCVPSFARCPGLRDCSACCHCVERSAVAEAPTFDRARADNAQPVEGRDTGSGHRAAAIASAKEISAPAAAGRAARARASDAARARANPASASSGDPTQTSGCTSSARSCRRCFAAPDGGATKPDTSRTGPAGHHHTASCGGRGCSSRNRITATSGSHPRRGERASIQRRLPAQPLSGVSSSFAPNGRTRPGPVTRVGHGQRGSERNRAQDRVRIRKARSSGAGSGAAVEIRAGSPGRTAGGRVGPGADSIFIEGMSL